MGYNAGDFNKKIQLNSIVENYVWLDFKVGVDGTWIVFRRVKEKYYPRKKDNESEANHAA